MKNELKVGDVRGRIAPHLVNINRTTRKYLLGSSRDRLAIFLAQTHLETDRWKTFREYGRGASHPGIPMAQYYSAFYGRGIMQLTWAGHYESYGKFRALPENFDAYADDRRITQSSVHYWSDPTERDRSRRIIGMKGVPRQWAPRYDPDLVASDSELACDSGGFFWVWKQHGKARNINRVSDRGFTARTIDRVNILVNGGSFGYFERFVFSWYARYILTDWIPQNDIEVVMTARAKIGVRVSYRRPQE